MAKGRSVRPSRAGFGVLVLVALLGLGAFLWTSRGSRESRSESALATEISVESVGTDAELVPGPRTTDPVRVEHREAPPEVASVAPDEVPDVAPSPEVGSLVVQVFTADGLPAEDGTAVHLRRASSRPRPAPLGVARAPDATATVEAGQARFEKVELGRELELDAGHHFQRGNATVVGPRTPDESVNVVLRLALEGTTLVFRAVDSSGQRFVGILESELRVWRVGNGRRSNSSKGMLVTDDRGSFAMELEAALLANERRALMVKAGGLAGLIDLSQTFPPGRIEMGDLVLAPMPLLAAGRVLDVEGRPAARALVSYEITRPAWLEDGAPPGKHSGSVATDALGAFALYELGGVPSVQLNASLGNQRSDSVEVATGTEGVELALPGISSLAGRLLLDGEVPAVLRIFLHRDGQRLGAGVLLGPNGTFEFRDVPCATYTLVIALRGEALVQVDDLEVLPGKVTSDPRIQALDVRQAVLEERARSPSRLHRPLQGVAR